jgi:hypothetical protein
MINLREGSLRRAKNDRIIYFNFVLLFKYIYVRVGMVEPTPCVFKNIELA